MDYLPSPCAAIGMQVNIDSSSTLSLPLIDRDEETAPEWFEVRIGGILKNEDSCL